MKEIRADAVRFLLLLLAFFAATPAFSQSASSLPEACATVLESIVRDGVAADQFADLRNAGAILCFSELAPKQPGASLEKNGAPAKLTPVSLIPAPAGSAPPSEASLKVLGTALNDAQEKIIRDLYHLQLSGADYENWKACVTKEFSAEQISYSSQRASKFFTYWTQLAGIVFQSKTMNCQPNAPLLSETAIHGLWPTKTERDELRPKYKGLLSDVETEENRFYWGLKLLDSIDEYRIALKVFDDAATHLAESARHSSSARALPIGLTQPGSCKIAGPSPTAPASGMPVTINLCKDSQASPSASMQFAVVDVYEHISGKRLAGQPSSSKQNSFVLSLQTPGAYDINSTIIPASGSGAASNTTFFLFESCANPSLQLCAFTTVTSHGSAGSFELKVN